MNWAEEFPNARSFGISGAGEDENFVLSYTNPYPNTKDSFPCSLDVGQRYDISGEGFIIADFSSPIGDLNLSLDHDGNIMESELKIKHLSGDVTFSIHGVTALQVTYWSLQRAIEVLQKEGQGSKGQQEILPKLASFLKALVL